MFPSQNGPVFFHGACHGSHELGHHLLTLGLHKWIYIYIHGLHREFQDIRCIYICVYMYISFFVLLRMVNWNPRDSTNSGLHRKKKSVGLQKENVARDWGLGQAHGCELLVPKNEKYCWWCREIRRENHLGCIKPVVNNGINYQPQLVSRISSINSNSWFPTQNPRHTTQPHANGGTDFLSFEK